MKHTTHTYTIEDAIASFVDNHIEQNYDFENIVVVYLSESNFVTEDDVEGYIESETGELRDDIHTLRENIKDLEHKLDECHAEIEETISRRISEIQIGNSFTKKLVGYFKSARFLSKLANKFTKRLPRLYRKD